MCSQKVCVAWELVLSGAIYVGTVIGWIWGGETCGQLPTRSKQILGAWALPYFIPKRGSVTQKVECCPRGFQLTWPFPLFTSLLPVYTRHKHPRARSRLQMSSQLCWLHTDTVTLCSISFSGRRESPISCGWEWGRPFGQVAIFLLFQELGEAFKLSPVKIAFGMRTALPPAS